MEHFIGARLLPVFAIPLLFTAGQAQAPSFKPAPVGTLKQVMRGILLPASDLIFKVQGEPPKSDAEWAALENSAIAISEAAALIAMPGRLRDNGQPVPAQRADWAKYSQGLLAAGKEVYRAARSKNQNTVSDSTEKLAEACANCHDVYRDAPQPAPAKAAPAGKKKQ